MACSAPALLSYLANQLHTHMACSHACLTYSMNDLITYPPTHTCLTHVSSMAQMYVSRSTVSCSPTSLHAYMHTCIHAYMHACMHACILAHIHVHVHVPQVYVSRSTVFCSSSSQRAVCVGLELVNSELMPNRQPRNCLQITTRYVHMGALHMGALHMGAVHMGAVHRCRASVPCIWVPCIWVPLHEYHCMCMRVHVYACACACACMRVCTTVRQGVYTCVRTCVYHPRPCPRPCPCPCPRPHQLATSQRWQTLSTLHSRLHSDGETFPVHRTLLRPCIALTKAVRDTSCVGKEVDVAVDCATFDRVLLYLEAATRGVSPVHVHVHTNAACAHVYAHVHVHATACMVYMVCACVCSICVHAWAQT